MPLNAWRHQGGIDRDGRSNMNITQELLLLTDVFGRDRVSYAICGGLAVAIHGRPRLTLDIDFLVPADQMNQALATAASVGFDDAAGWIMLPENGHGIDRLFRVNKLEQDDFLTLDLLEVRSSDHPLFQSRETIEVEGHTLQLLSRAALIQMKRSSKRLKDQLDVELLNDRTDER
jgi:hypothetical protein